MRSIPGQSYRLCDGVTRRDFLRIGALGMGGLALPELLRAEVAAGLSSKKSVIMIYLAGGPPHQDMFDLKMDAPSEIRGPFKPISTNVSGIQICEYFPRLAKIMDKMTILRSIVGSDGRHTPDFCYTGRSGAKNAPEGGWPSIGAVTSKLQGAMNGSVPSSVGLSPDTRNPDYGRVGPPGFLGDQCKAFRPQGEAMADMKLNGISASRFAGRRNLLAQEQKKLEQLEKDAETADAADLKAHKAVVRHQGWARDAVLLIPIKQKIAKKAADKLTACEGALGTAEQALKQADADWAAATKTAAGSEQPYRTVAFSADGQQLAMAGDDGKSHLYDSDRRAALDTLDAHTRAVSVVCYTPRGQLISAADKTVTRWNPNGQWDLVRTIGDVDDATQLVDRVTALTFSPDGKTLATGSGQPSRSGQLKLWNVADGVLVHDVVHPHSDTILGLDFSPRGDRIVSASADHSVKMFRVDDGSFLRVFEGHTHHVLGVSWKFDGRLIASCGADNVVKIRSFDGATDFLYSAAASDDGKHVIAGGEDSVLRVWDGTNGKALYQFEPEGNGK